jgi:hypothetical protein
MSCRNSIDLLIFLIIIYLLILSFSFKTQYKEVLFSVYFQWFAISFMFILEFSVEFIFDIVDSPHLDLLPSREKE